MNNVGESIDFHNQTEFCSLNRNKAQQTRQERHGKNSRGCSQSTNDVGYATIQEFQFSKSTNGVWHLKG